MTNVIVEALERAHLITADDIGTWLGAAPLLSAFRVLEREGVVATVKVDGERDDNRYTIVLSGGPLGSDYFRGDGRELVDVLEEALRYYNDKVWHLSM